MDARRMELDIDSPEVQEGIRKRVLIKEALAQLEELGARWESEKAERQWARAVLDFAEGDQISHLKPNPHESKDYFAARRKFSPNLLGWAAGEMSLLYDEDPIRATDDAETWERVSWGYGEGLSEVLKEADFTALLTGTCFVWRVFTPSLDRVRVLRKILSGDELELNEEEAGIEGVVIARDRFAALPHREDPRFAEAILVHMGSRSYKTAVGAGRVDTFHFWNDQVFMQVERRSGAIGGSKFTPMLLAAGDGSESIILEHGYEQIPLVPVHLKRPKLTLCVKGWGGEDLITNFTTIADLLSNLVHTTGLQRGQPYYVGDGEVEDNVLSPFALWRARGNGTFGIASNNANIDGFLKVITRIIELLHLTLGVPARAFRFEMNQAQSGVAIHADRSELEKWRKKRAGYFTGVERKIHRLDAALLEQHLGLSLDPAVSTTYHPWTPPRTTEQTRQAANDEWERGLVSSTDYLRDTRPELSQSDVEERVLRARAEHPQKHETIPIVSE